MQVRRGFGRTGTVNWQTAIKTSGFTAANGEGYFIDTNSGGFTVNLPAGSAGDIVAFKDYRNTFDTGALVVAPNGTDKIGGVNADAIFNTESQSVTLIFTDSTRGWLDIHDSTTACNRKIISYKLLEEQRLLQEMIKFIPLQVQELSQLLEYLLVQLIMWLVT